MKNSRKGLQLNHYPIHNRSHPHSFILIQPCTEHVLIHDRSKPEHYSALSTSLTGFNGPNTSLEHVATTLQCMDMKWYIISIIVFASSLCVL
jgi:hypothetical protein